MRCLCIRIMYSRVDKMRCLCIRIIYSSVDNMRCLCIRFIYSSVDNMRCLCILCHWSFPIFVIGTTMYIFMSALPFG